MLFTELPLKKRSDDFFVRCRSRHSVSKGPPDLSPKFFRFAWNLDTRVRVPTTRNNKNSEADKYLLRYFGTLEGTRTPDLLVRSHRENLKIYHFKSNLILFSPLFPPDYSIISMLYWKYVVNKWSKPTKKSEISG